jgi:hypothetical protein
VNRIRTGERWNTEVRIRHTSVEAKPHVEQITCYFDSARFLNHNVAGRGPVHYQTAFCRSSQVRDEDLILSVMFDRNYQSSRIKMRTSKRFGLVLPQPAIVLLRGTSQAIAAAGVRNSQ